MWRPSRRGLAVRRLIRRDDGVAMAEFALILPVFMLIVVGMLVVGRLFFYWIETNHVANETARWVIVDRNPYLKAPCTLATATGADDCQSLQQHAVLTATGEFSDNARVCIDFPETPSGTAVQVGDPVRVRVQVPASFFDFFGFDVTIRGSSTMRVERLEGKDLTDVTKPPFPANYAAASPFGACS
jgi:hypothetical protein